MAGFDLDGARQAGASDDQIRDFLVKDQGFDLDGARQAGASDDQIIKYLSGIGPATVPAGTIGGATPSRKDDEAQPPADVLAPVDTSRTPELREAPTPLSEVASGALQNLPGSAAELVKTVVQPFTSVENLTNTAKSIGMLAEGLIHELIPGEHPSEKAVEAVGRMYAERFGGLENVKRTIRDDPAGFMADLSFVMGIGGAVVAKGAKLAGATKTARAAVAVGKVGKALDPLRLAGAVISKPIKLAGKLGKTVIGNMVTGVGAETIQKAFDAPPDYIKALKGQLSMEDVLRSAKGGLQGMKEDRAAAYISELAKVKGSAAIIDMVPIKKRMVDRLVTNYRGKIRGDGTLDLSNSVFSDAVQNDVQKVYDLVSRWDATPGNTSAIGMDTLKRRLDDFFAPSKNSRAFVTSLRNEVKNELVKKVGLYSKMTKKYAEASDVLNQIEKGLSLGDRASMDGTIRKLSTIMKENNEFRRGLLGKLEDASGIDFSAQIAGIQMQNMLPQGLIGRLTDVSIASNILYKGILATDPALFAALMATSPRVMATFLNTLGKGVRGIGKAFRGVTTVSPTAFQVERAGIRARETQEPVLE